MRSPRHHHRLGREDGSLLFALLGSLVIGGLAVALIAMAINAQQQVRRERDYNVAIQGADAGVQQALTYVSDIIDPTVTSLSSGGLGLSASETTVGGVSYEWEATKVDPTTWAIRATATSGDRERVVEATAEQPSEFFIGAFADEGFRMNGSNTSTSYNSNNGSTNTGNGSIGSNGAITMNGNAYSNLVYLFGAGATCTGNGCSDPATVLNGVDEAYDLAPIESAIQSAMDTQCSGGFTAWRATIDGAPAYGDVICATDAYFDQDVTFTGDPANGAVLFYVTGTVDTDNGIDVNCPGCNGSSTPDSTSLIIRSTGPRVLIGNHVAIAGAINAPTASCEGSPSNAQAEIFGSLLCNDLRNQGGWDFHFDDSLLAIGSGQFDIVEWREEVGGTTSQTSP